MFATAGEKIKFPHLLLRHDRDGYAETLKVWIAGARSMQPGSFSVTTTAVAREWLGRIMQDGTWTPGHSRSAAEYDSVADLLSELIAAPHAFLASQRQVGRRVLLLRDRTHRRRSIEAGYGPTCAKKWGLPWGRKRGRTGTDPTGDRPRAIAATRSRSVPAAGTTRQARQLAHRRRATAQGCSPAQYQALMAGARSRGDASPRSRSGCRDNAATRGTWCRCGPRPSA